MVIDIAKKNNINDLLESVNTEVTELVNEFYYSILADKYEYLQENGVVMEADQEQAVAQGRFKQFIEKIKQAFKDAWNWIIRSLKKVWQKLTGKKKEEVKQDIENTNKEAAETENAINNATNPEEASAAVQKFVKKQQEKAKKYQVKDQEKLNSFKPEQKHNEVLQQPAKVEPEKFEPEKFEPEKFESERFEPERFEPERFEPEKFEPERFFEPAKPAEPKKTVGDKTSAQLKDDKKSINNQIDRIRKEISLDQNSMKKSTDRIKQIDDALKVGPNKNGIYFVQGRKKSEFTLDELKQLRARHKSLYDDARSMLRDDTNELHRLMNMAK